MFRVVLLRTVKSQIVAATSIIMIVILVATAYLVIDRKVKEINADIATKAISFAELTTERIVTNYENNYLQQATANFEREMADIYSLNTDITQAFIFDYNGKSLYAGKDNPQNDIKLSGTDLERVQQVFPSVKVATGGRIIYVAKSEGKTRYTDSNGKDVTPLKDTEQIGDIIFPFRDPNNPLRAYSVRYRVSYDSVGQRVRATAFSIAFIALFGIAIAIYVGNIVSGKITAPIKTLTEGAERIGKGDLKTRIQVKSRNEVGLLADTFNRMAQDLEKNTGELVEKKKMEKELEVAGDIQRELLPKTVPITKNLEFAASLVSASQVGGDCYDFLPIDENRLMFYVADVTGHGVPAGLVAAINNALVLAYMEHYQTTYDIIVHLNRLLKLKTKPNVFMTMVLAMWDADAATLEFTQAGHDPILHYKAAEGSINELPPGGMALGMLPDISKIAKPDHVKIERDDVIVLYTDGIPEAWHNEKMTLGMESFKDIVRRCAPLRTAQEIHDGIIKEVREFMGDYPQMDDITIIVAKRTI